MNQPTLITYNLTPQVVDIIVAGLRKLPHEVSDELIKQIIEHARATLAPEPAADSTTVVVEEL